MRRGLFGSTAIEVSFWGAPAVSGFTVTAGARIEVPSRGLASTFAGVIGPGPDGAFESRLSSSMKAENRICRPAVPFTEATLPASVLMSYDCPDAAGNVDAAGSIRRHSIMQAFFMAFPLTVISIFASARGNRRCDG